MTADRKRKREICERMARTGEPYSVAARKIEEERSKQAERARRDQPWRGRRPQGGDVG